MPLLSRAASTDDGGEGFEMSVRHDLAWVAFLAVAVSLIGCAPPPPSPGTEGLVPRLISLGELGDPFDAASTESVGMGGGEPCPDAGYGIEDHGAVRATFTAGDQVTLTETLWLVEDGIVPMFDALKSAYDECDGRRWTDYGETYVLEVTAAPEVGDDRLAYRLRFGDAIRGDGNGLDDERTVIVAVGDVFAEFTLSERLDDVAAPPTISDEVFHAVVLEAVSRLGD
jgi:hypothetical protein